MNVLRIFGGVILHNFGRVNSLSYVCASRNNVVEDKALFASAAVASDHSSSRQSGG